ncbi:MULTISPECIES: Lrp/AsnC family transcriptional regulator [unclassified Paenibacillus]|uniref:Lrp/AsnC family transcriptional regulator n=1 Tax=unclassified Paenibacillus TaxID=185978 RepID=UPI0010532572|nr:MULTISPECIES: Lrp/AsnC family transcriptional regulator [unclassified Paenibacillus]NIK69203.1 DNA-binding Lrp family transcriptional regulator [Paenibacillus sp. BK720]TCM92841.1 DNA-binding Lrp family transcriptional regulator [Paenibacillus sp. BK033]
MDQIDHKILSILHDNARITISEMSRIIAMSQPAVTERLRKLEEQGVITGYRAELSLSKLGKYTTAFVLFKSSHCKEFEAFSEAAPEIVDFYRTSGEYNYLLKVVTETSETLESFLEKCHTYGFSSTLVVLSTRFEDKLFSAILPNQA